jgi:hypothetical protein
MPLAVAIAWLLGGWVSVYTALLRGIQKGVFEDEHPVYYSLLMGLLGPLMGLILWIVVGCINDPEDSEENTLKPPAHSRT